MSGQSNALLTTQSRASAPAQEAQRIAEAVFESCGISNQAAERALLAPLAEFLNRPGKGFRAELVGRTWEISGGAPGAVPNELALALELVHAGSLIVDDIQDESQHRRGLPALHLMFGIPLALNTGNWLYFAAETLVDEIKCDASTKLRLLQSLRSAVLRCHQGQGLDLSTNVSTIEPSDVYDLVTATTMLKTGALFELAARFGAIAAQAEASVEEALVEFSRDLGCALQMFDDLGSVIAPERRLKGVEDMRAARPTWAWAWAAELLDAPTLRGLQRQLADVTAGAPPEALMTSMATLVERHGAAAASAMMRSAHRKLAERVSACRALDALQNEIKDIEASYV